MPMLGAKVSSALAEEFEQTVKRYEEDVVERSHVGQFMLGNEVHEDDLLGDAIHREECLDVLGAVFARLQCRQPWPLVSSLFQWMPTQLRVSRVCINVTNAMSTEAQYAQSENTSNA